MKNSEKDIERLMFLSNFINENKKAGKLSSETANQVRQLWDEYKQTDLNSDCAIINADFGLLGSLVVRYILSFDNPTRLNYKEGAYDFISIKADNSKRILWTDYQNIEPYNRQGGLYCDGATFASLGLPVVEKKEYREFVYDGKYPENIAFAVWGFSYNDFYGSVTFGICIQKEKVNEFIEKLRTIIGK